MRSNGGGAIGAGVRLAACFGLTLAAAAGTSAAPIIERVMAIVSGSVVTLSDVNAAVGLGLVTVEGAADPTIEALDRLIDRTLMLAEVERYAPPEPVEQEVDARVQALRARLGAGPAVARLLAAYGLTAERLRAIARDDLRLASYLGQRFGPSVSATDEEVLRFYREHQDEFTSGGVVAPLAEIEPEVRRRLDAARRESLIDEWTRGLRLRADVTVLYLPSR